MISNFEKAYMRIISEMNDMSWMPTRVRNKFATMNTEIDGMTIRIDGLDDNDYHNDMYKPYDDLEYMDKFYDIDTIGPEKIEEIHNKLFAYKDIVLEAYLDEPDFMKIQVNALVDGSSIEVLLDTDWEKVVDNSKNREILFHAKDRNEFEKILSRHKVTDFSNHYKFIKIDGISNVEVDGDEIDEDDFMEQYPELYNKIMNLNPTKGKNVVFGFDPDVFLYTFRTV